MFGLGYWENDIHPALLWQSAGGYMAFMGGIGQLLNQTLDHAVRGIS